MSWARWIRVLALLSMASLLALMFGIPAGGCGGVKQYYDTGNASGTSLGSSSGSGSTSGSTSSGVSVVPDSGVALPPCVVDVNCARPTSNREEVFLTGDPGTNPDATGWKFNQGDVTGAEMPTFDDTAWTSLNLPYTWDNLSGGLRGAMQANPVNFYTGIGWFRRSYTIPSDMMGKRIYIQFDESEYLTDVYINGTHVGQHAGGYARFRFDITSAVMVGAKNVIAVKVDNSAAVSSTNAWTGGANANTAPLSGDFTLFGGIERDIRILATDNLAISPIDFGSPGVYMKWDAPSSTFTATVRLLNMGPAAAMANDQVDILDEMNTVFQSFSGMQMVPPSTVVPSPAIPAPPGPPAPTQTTTDAVITGQVTSPHLWAGLDDPYVYHVNITVSNASGTDAGANVSSGTEAGASGADAGVNVTDAIVQPFGFRSYVMDPNTGFSLNGKPYALHGVCMHQDHCVATAQGGFPNVCTGLGGQFSFKDPQYIDLILNDFGMLKEIGNNFTRFAHYQHSDFTYSMADYQGIVTWAENAFVNRVPGTCLDGPSCAPFTANTQQQLTELIRQNYNHPAIFFWSVGNEVLLKPGPTPLLVMQNLASVAKMEDPSRTTVFAANAGTDGNSVDWTPEATYFNEYYGWYGLYVAGIGPWADGVHAAHPTTPLGMSEYGAGANPTLHQLPNVETGADRTLSYQSEEYQTYFHELYWAAIIARPFLTITSVWNMFDFASVYRDEASEPGINTKGLVTYDRTIKKDAFYFYKAQWSKEPVTYITSRRFQTAISGTPFTNSSTTIKVYSNQPSLTLTLNGTALPAPAAPVNNIWQWPNVTWGSGANTVVVTAPWSCVAPASGAAMACTDTVTWQ